MTPLRLTGACELAAGAAKPPRLAILAYGGGVMRVEGFGAVVIDLAGLAIPESLPVLDGHTNTTEAVIGVGMPELRAGQLHVNVALADTDAGRRVVELLRAGVALQASVGVAPAETRRLREGETVEANGRTHTAPPGGVTLVARGTLKEVSILPLGADSETEVRLAARRAAERNTMEPETVLAAERQRVVDIDHLTSEHPELRAKAIAEGWSAEKTEMEVLRAERDAALLRATRAERPAAPHVRGAAAPDVATRDVLTGALLLRAGYAAVGEKSLGARAMEAAAELRANSLAEICAAALRLAGRDLPRDRQEMIRAAFSTENLPVALGASANKIALSAYREAPASWRAFANVATLRDFKSHNMIRVVFGQGYTKVGPGGELKHGDLREEGYTVQAETQGQIFGITRQSVINDDLQVFAGTAQALGRAAARAVADEVYETLLANLTPGGATFFSADNNNYITGADTALSATGLEIAVANMVKRTDADGRPIDVRPRVLLVPPDLEWAAKQLLASETLARYTSSSNDQRAEGNPFFRAFDLAVEPRLNSTAFPGGGAKVWYLFAAPTDAAVVVGFVGGSDAPTVEQVDAAPDQLGVVFRGFLDFGVSLADPRATTKIKGEV